MKKLFLFLLILTSPILPVSADESSDATVSTQGNLRCVSSGLRLATAWRKLGQPDAIFRFRRKAIVDIKGKLTLVFPTFYMGRKEKSLVVEEIPFPNTLRIQAAIEPAYKMSSTDLKTSRRIMSDIITCDKESADAYKTVTINLGDTVIGKGSWYGIWVQVENVDGQTWLPFSRNLGSKRMQTFEAYYSPTGGALFQNNALGNLDSFKPEPVEREWARMGFCPVVILANTDYTGDVWGIIGSSIPYGHYDIAGDQYGDENGNAGYADKLFSTRLACPSVNLSVGSDRFQYCAAGFIKRLEIMKRCGVNKVHYGLGGNDISGKRNENKLLTDSKTLSEHVRAAIEGVYIVGATVLPHSTSTDKFSTFTRQTPRDDNAGADSIRGRWNAMVRSSAKLSGCDNMFELCSYVENDWVNGASLWGSPTITPSTLTIDGTHPSCSGSTAIAEHAFLLNNNK